MKTLLKKAERLALSEVRKYKFLPEELFRISIYHSKLLAIKHKANQDICLLGSMLSDLKLGEAIEKGKIKDHIEMSKIATKKFMEKENADQNLIDSVLYCIETHHGTAKYNSIEAEIVANADCYRFLLPRGVFGLIESVILENRMTLGQMIDYIEEKTDEKWNIISLPDVKKELEPNYILIKKFLELSK